MMRQTRPKRTTEDRDAERFSHSIQTHQPARNLLADLGFTFKEGEEHRPDREGKELVPEGEVDVLEPYSQTQYL